MAKTMTAPRPAPPARAAVTPTRVEVVVPAQPQLYAAYRYGDLAVLEPILVRVAGTAKRLARGKA